MIIGKAAMTDGTIVAGIESVGTNYEGASGIINFLPNGDIGGNDTISVPTVETTQQEHTLGKF